MKNISFTKRAEKDFQKIDSPFQKSIVKKLKQLQKDEIEILPLTGTWKGWFKLRVGDYRILLTRNDENNWIVGYIRHRREVYKN